MTRLVPAVAVVMLCAGIAAWVLGAGWQAAALGALAMVATVVIGSALSGDGR